MVVVVVAASELCCCFDVMLSLSYYGGIACLMCTSCFAKMAFQTPEQIVCTEFQRRLADFVRKDTCSSNKSQQDQRIRRGADTIQYHLFNREKYEYC